MTSSPRATPQPQGRRAATLRAWVEAMRLRTLPVSVAGVVWAGALGALSWHFRLAPWLLCMAFAVLAQVASNFANEYYDYAAGLDKAGRQGPRRGVTEGDIAPAAMLRATWCTLALACAVGIVLVALWGSWWMYPAGAAIAIGALAYSTGPWPLSHHGLGELAVTLFFGFIPVSLTYMLMGGTFTWWVGGMGAGIGLMGANVLLVNNYRDHDDDLAVGKHTLAVMLGRNSAPWLYLASGYLAVILTFPAWLAAARWGWVVPIVYLGLHTLLYARLRLLKGSALNPLLGITAMLMLAYALALAVACIVQ